MKPTTKSFWLALMAVLGGAYGALVAPADPVRLAFTALIGATLAVCLANALGRWVEAVRADAVPRR